MVKALRQASARPQHPRGPQLWKESDTSRELTSRFHWHAHVHTDTYNRTFVMSWVLYRDDGSEEQETAGSDEAMLSAGLRGTSLSCCLSGSSARVFRAGLAGSEPA